MAITTWTEVANPIALDAHKDRHDPEDGADPLDTAAPSELASVQAAGVGSSHSFARADHQHQIQESMADNHLVTVNDADAANADYAKFTSTGGLEGRSSQELVNDISGVIKGTDVEVSELSTATYDDVQDFINFFGNRTPLSGGAVTDNGDGTAAVASLTAWCKISDSETATSVFFDFAGGNTPALTDLTINYVFLDYNAGTPQLVVATSILTYGFQHDHVPIATIYRDGTTLHIAQQDAFGIASANRVYIHLYEHHGVHRVSGMVTTSTGTRNLDITAGVLYEGLSRHTTSPFTTPNSGTADATEANKLHDADGGFASTDVGKRIKNTTDTTYANVTAFVDSGELTLDADIFESGETYDLDIFSYWYYDGDLGTPAWVEVTGSTAISNTQYNDIATGLANLTANRYGVHWVYLDIDGSHLHIVYGQGDYTAAQAEEATLPSSLPNIVKDYCVLLAKIICQQGTDVLTISYPWTSVFTTSLATDHGSLAGLGDDDHAQYVKDAEFTQDSGILVGTGSGTFQEETGATLRTSIGVGTGDSPQVTAVNIGHASDTTLARSAAGRLTVESVNLVRGPGSAVDNAIARFSGTTGDLVQDYTSNPPTISDSGDMNIDGDLDVENIVVSGNVDGVDVSAHDTATTGVHGAGGDTIATDADITTHAAIKSANATLGHVIVETGSDIDVDGDGKLTLGAHKDNHDPEDGSDALDTAAPSALLEVQAQAVGTSHSLARADHAHAIVHDITDNSLVTVDGTTNAPVNSDYAKWTANGLEGMEKSQILSDLNVADGADVTGSNTCDTPGGAGTDTTAIHDNVANEITAITLKGTPAADDEIVLEDSAASYVKKSATIATVGAGIKLDDLATPDDNTDLNASATEHGYK
jgi:hypothetical protein